MIAGIALGVVAAVAMALRRRQERSILEAWAGRHGWQMEPSATELTRLLSCSSLMKIGHSRRFSAIAADPQGVRLFEYACETGFEHDREQHRWFGAIVPVDHRHSHTVFTHEPWVVAVAMKPSYELIPSGNGVDAGEHRTGVMLAEDPVEWKDLPATELGKRLGKESSNRSWEVLPGCLLCFEPVPGDESQVSELASAAKEIARFL